LKIEKLVDFFAGTWKVEGKETYEMWELSGDSLIGKGYKVNDGAEKISETLAIKSIDREFNDLTSVLDQNDGKTVKFKMTGFAKDEFTFENPEHDFPKKLFYRKNSPTELFMQVLGDDGKGFSLKMIKVKPAN
jgi:hypothetical protein